MAKDSQRSSMRRAVHARDAGLRKISIATRVFVVGSVAATGAFSALAAWAQPGRSTTVTSAGAVVGRRRGVGSGFGTRTSRGTLPATTPTTAVAAGGSDDTAGENLTPPTSPPAPTYQYTPPTYQYAPPVVVSGAS